MVEHCKGVNYLEHVQAKITLTTQRRGDIQIILTSPAGTRVTLLTERYKKAYFGSDLTEKNPILIFSVVYGKKKFFFAFMNNGYLVINQIL